VADASLEQGATLVQKGQTDIIARGAAPALHCDAAGAPRRCGGQGDVLAGTTGVFVAWAVDAARRAGDASAADLALAAYAACLVTRTSAARAFEARKRSMVAGDLIGELGAAMEAIAPCS
jgi:ATP-dependent NAD(P)H-hydrate dehydratase